MGNPHKRSEEKVLRYIYEIKSNLDGRTYIGKHTPYRNEDFEVYYGSGTYITNAIKKYGKENFSKRILFEDICTEEEINNKEIYYISEERKKGKAEFNITSGGDGGYNENTYKSPKWRESISRSQKKVWANKDYKEKQMKKMRDSLNNKTKEEKAEIVSKRRTTIANKTEEEKAKTSEKRRLAMINRTEEEKAKSLEKRRITIANRTEEEKAKISEKHRITLANKSEEEKSNSAKKGVLHRSEQAKINCSHKGCHWKQSPEALIKRYERYLKSAKEKNNLSKVNEYLEKIRLLKTTVKGQA